MARRSEEALPDARPPGVGAPAAQELLALLSIGKLAVGGESYYLDAVTSGREDYYLADGEAPGRWTGRGAERLGLAGEVGPPDLRSALAGHAPGGDPLAEAPWGRRRLPGYDLTFSAPKSVSLLYALGDSGIRSRTVAAHEAAVEAALDYLEAHAAWLRRGHNGLELLRAQGLVGAAFRHRTSRLQDPALHTHLLVANLGMAADGRSGALDGRALYRHAATAGYLYQAELRHRLSRELGVTWGPVIRGAAEVEGISDDVLRHFSQRRAEVERELDLRDADGAHASRAATVRTRRAKDPLPPVDQLHQSWRARAVALGFGPAELRATLHREQPAGGERDGEERIAHELAGPEGLTRDRSHFDRRRVVRAFAEHLRPEAGAAKAEWRAERFLNSDRVVELAAPGPAGERRYSTPALLRLERELVETAARRCGAGAGLVPEPLVEDAIWRRPALSAEQREMVRRLARDGDGVAVVQGRAGAGKTYALDPAREAWERSGHRVIGAALAARAASELQAGAGIPAQTVARLRHGLFEGELRLDARTVLVLDEAGMVGTRALAELSAHAERAGAKLVLVGDSAQLPEIEAGGAFAGLSRRLGPIVLEGNRRQREPWEREALADIRDGRAQAAVVAYGQAGRIRLAESAEGARERLVGDWWADRVQGGDSLMVAARRRDARELSRRARGLMVEAGEVSGPELFLPTGSFAVGDRVLALRNRRALGVQNGMRATVGRVDIEAGQLQVRTDRGERITLPRAYLEAGHLEHGYAVTAHKAQGLTVERAYVLGPEDLSREWAYTALSRARGETRVYLVGGEGIRDLLAAELGGGHVVEERDPLSELARGLARSRAQEMGLEVGP